MHLRVQPLYPIILCTSRLAQFAHDSSGDESNSLSRACIVHCPLIVEALANSLLSTWDIESGFSGDLEKLTTFAKLQLFSRKPVGGKVFAKGSRAGQIMSDLIKLRNEYVHPKILTEKDIELRDEAYYVSVGSDLSSLGISRNPEVWKPADAVQVFGKTLESIDAYLMDDIKICNRQVEQIMLHHVLDANDKPVLVTVKEKPWNMSLPDGVSMPRFMRRLESHDPFCVN